MYTWRTNTSAHLHLYIYEHHTLALTNTRNPLQASKLKIHDLLCYNKHSAHYTAKAKKLTEASENNRITTLDSYAVI